MTKRILIAGGDGLLGRSLAGFLRDAGRDVIVTTRRCPVKEPAILLDLVDEPTTWPELPDVDAAVICAAATSIKQCADDPTTSAKVNVGATIELAERLIRRGTFVLFVSSNQVFDGTSPLVDRNTRYCPVSAYGRQKAVAEAAILAMGASAAILRVSKILASTQPMLIEWMCNLRKGTVIRPFFDFTLAPVMVNHATAMIEALIAARQPGLFQLSGAHDVSYVELAYTIARRDCSDRSLIRPRPAIAAESGFEVMPRYTSMDMARERRELGVTAPESWAIINDVVASLVESEVPRQVA